MATNAPRGRPRSSPLTRTEQLRASKRAQRLRERTAGLASVTLKLPEPEAERLRAAAMTPGFHQALAAFLAERMIALDDWPILRELAWNRADRWIPAEEALALYERNWRHVDPRRIAPDENALVERLKARYGGGILHA
jgi:hypothetical protein